MITGLSIVNDITVFHHFPVVGSMIAFMNYWKVDSLTFLLVVCCMLDFVGEFY